MRPEHSHGSSLDARRLQDPPGRRGRILAGVHGLENLTGGLVLCCHPESPPRGWDTTGLTFHTFGNDAGTVCTEGAIVTPILQIRKQDQKLTQGHMA